MRIPSDVQKEILRHLSAARFYLPVVLRQPDDYDAESQYIEYLHHTEYELALECLEDLGNINSNFAEELYFWSELLFAAQLMELAEHIAMCKSKIASCDKP